MASATIALLSNDGMRFEVPREKALCSQTIRNLVLALGSDDSRSWIMELPLQNIDGFILRKIVEWMINREEDMECDEIQLTDCIAEWDRSWFERMSLNERVGIANASIFLEIDRLTDNVARIIASMMNRTTRPLSS